MFFGIALKKKMYSGIFGIKEKKSRWKDVFTPWTFETFCLIWLE